MDLDKLLRFDSLALALIQVGERWVASSRAVQLDWSAAGPDASAARPDASMAPDASTASDAST